MGFTTAEWEDIRDRQSSLASGLVLLSDTEMEVIDRFDLRRGRLGVPLARPAAFIIGSEREVLWRSHPRTWRHRIDPGEVLELYRNRGRSE